MLRNLFILFLSTVWVYPYALAQQIQWYGHAHPYGYQTNGVQYTSDGQSVLTGTDCHPAMIKMFKASNGDEEWDYTLSNNLMCVMSVGLSSSGDYFAAVEEFGNLLIFDNTVSPPDSIDAIDLGTDYAFSMDFSPDNSKVAVGASNGKLLICALQTGTIEQSVKGHISWVTSVAYDPNGQFIVTGGGDKRIKLWDNGGNQITVFSGHQSEITSVRVSNDGKTIYSSSQDNTIKVWNVPGDSIVTSIRVSKADVNDIVLSPGNEFLVSVSSDSTIRFFQTADFQRVDSIFEPDHDYGLSIDWSPTAAQIAVGTKSGKIVAYDIGNVVHVVDRTPVTEQPWIYPNPAQDEVHVESPSSSSYDYIIYDLRGQIMGKGTVARDRTSIDVSHLAPGAYLMRMSSDQEPTVYSHTLIKQ